MFVNLSRLETQGKLIDTATRSCGQFAKFMASVGLLSARLSKTLESFVPFLAKLISKCGPFEQCSGEHGAKK